MSSNVCLTNPIHRMQFFLFSFSSATVNLKSNIWENSEVESEVQIQCVFVLPVIDQMPPGCQHMMPGRRWICIQHFSSKAVSVDARNLIDFDFGKSSHPHNTFSFKLCISHCLYFTSTWECLVNNWSIWTNKTKLKDLHSHGCVYVLNPSVIKQMRTLLDWRIKVSKVNSEKKHNLKLSSSSWEIHLWYLLFQLFLLFSRTHHHHHHHHGLHHHPRPHLLSSVVSQQSEPESEINHSGSLFALEAEHD